MVFYRKKNLILPHGSQAKAGDPMRKHLILLIMIAVLPIQVFAHPGQTDSNGGHYDHDSGEYHYHHGYEAHRHYDMDGDGDVDCPYNFHDQTGINSGGDSDGSSTDRSYYSSDATTNSTSDSTAHTEIKEKMPPWGIWTIIALSTLSIILYFVIRSKNSQISIKDASIEEFKSALKDRNTEISRLTELEKRWRISAHEAEAEADRATKRAAGLVQIRDKEIAIIKEEAQSLREHNDKLLKMIPFQRTEPKKANYEPIEIPDDIYFVRGTVPVKGKVNEAQPFGDFTVFVAHKGQKYHTDRFCSTSYFSVMKPAHVYDVIGTRSACHKCALWHPCGHQRTPPEWYIKVNALAKEIEK